MKIDFTKKEYTLLLEVLYIADWVLNAYREETEIKRYKKVEQKIMACAKDFSLTELVEWDLDFKEYFFTQKFEEEKPVMEHIEQFENETFWDELIERLSWRDLICKYGKKAVLEMDIHTKWEKQEEFRKIYALEFEKNGVDNLKLICQLTN